MKYQQLAKNLLLESGVIAGSLIAMGQ